MPIIRFAKQEDIDALTKMRFDFSCEYNSAITPADYAEFAPRCSAFLENALAVASNWRIWVAEVNETVVSHAVV